MHFNSPNVLDVLRDAQRRGFLGEAPVEDAVAHATGFAVATQGTPRRAADLGSGGGIPGLVLALLWRESRWTLVDSQARRCSFLVEATATLNLSHRVTVAHERAELVGRDADHRLSYDLVTARGFGPPAVVAECAAPLLAVGGQLVVSEPPGGVPERWPADRLLPLGLAVDAAVTAGASYQRLVQVAPCPEGYPRRSGVPGKRPLF